jgi:class 3 adenylate cyclase
MPDSAWLAVANEQLGQDIRSLRRLTRTRRAGLLPKLARPLRDHELDPEIIDLLKTIGLDVGDDLGREFATVVGVGEAGGLDPAALPHVIQAYVRGVGRIAAVEAGVAVRAIRAVPPEERERVIGELIGGLMPASVRGFDLLHRAMLQDALEEAAGGVSEDGVDAEHLAVGMVDLVRSTHYLAQADSEQLEHLVDVLFAAGQSATAARPAHVVKYVGDGVFFAANEVSDVADAALEMMAHLEVETPLQARGGIGYGRVVQRAGDVFGMPVNLSQALSKAAKPGTVLLSEDAARKLPASRRGRIRVRTLPHTALGDQCVATLRA